MKELVLKIDKVSFRLNESGFNLFFVKPLFVLLLYYGVYNRRAGLLGLTGGKTSVMISFGLFVLVLIHMLFIKKSLKLSNFSSLITLFFVLSGLFPLMSSFVFGSEPIRILRYSLEIASNFFMFFSTYYFVREKVITPKFFIYSIAILGVISSLGYLKVMLNSVTIYRIRGLTGLNTLGNSYALGIFSWILILYVNSERQTSKLRNYTSYFCILLLFLGMLFTGTRAAIIALFVGIAMFQMLGMKSKSFTRYLIIFCVGIAALLIIVTLSFDLTHLWGRFTPDSIIRMALIRFRIYAGSVTDLTLVDFLFGRPEFYIFSNEVDEFINPHNLFLATIRYNGIILFLILVLIFMGVFYKYFLLYKYHYRMKQYRVIETSMIILFVMVVIYTMFSGGRTTRSFNFFITLGYAVGYLEMFKNLHSYEEYEELIL